MIETEKNYKYRIAIQQRGTLYGGDFVDFRNVVIESNKKIDTIQRMIRKLFRDGSDVVYESRFH